MALSGGATTGDVKGEAEAAGVCQHRCQGTRVRGQCRRGPRGQGRALGQVPLWLGDVEMPPPPKPLGDSSGKAEAERGGTLGQLPTWLSQLPAAPSPLTAALPAPHLPARRAGGAGARAHHWLVLRGGQTRGGTAGRLLWAWLFTARPGLPSAEECSGTLASGDSRALDMSLPATNPLLQEGQPKAL